MKASKDHLVKGGFLLRGRQFAKKDLEDSTSQLNFAPVLCGSLIKKGRGKWPNDALAT